MTSETNNQWTILNEEVAKQINKGTIIKFQDGIYIVLKAALRHRTLFVDLMILNSFNKTYETGHMFHEHPINLSVYYGDKITILIEK